MPGERFDVVWGDDPNRVAERFKLSLPIECASTSLDTDLTSRRSADIVEKPRTPKAFAVDNVALGIFTVQLKHVLRKRPVMFALLS